MRISPVSFSQSYYQAKTHFTDNLKTVNFKGNQEQSDNDKGWMSGFLFYTAVSIATLVAMGHYVKAYVDRLNTETSFYRESKEISDSTSDKEDNPFEEPIDSVSIAEPVKEFNP